MGRWRRWGLSVWVYSFGPPASYREAFGHPPHFLEEERSQGNIFPCMAPKKNEQHASSQLFEHFKGLFRKTWHFATFQRSFSQEKFPPSRPVQKATLKSSLNALSLSSRIIHPNPILLLLLLLVLLLFLFFLPLMTHLGLRSPSGRQGEKRKKYGINQKSRTFSRSKRMCTMVYGICIGFNTLSYTLSNVEQ